MTAQRVLDFIEDVLESYAIRPTQKIDTLMQAIEEIEEEGEDVGDDADDDEEGD